MKSLFEQNRGTYRKRGDCLIHNLLLSESQENNIGIYGWWHLRYLQEHCKLTSINLLTSGELIEYLPDTDKQTQERFELLVIQMKDTQCITEQLTSENPIEWVGIMNCIRQKAEEIVITELLIS